MDIDIDPDLRESIERRANERGFESPEDYVSSLLRSVVEELDAMDYDERTQTRSTRRTSDDEINQRLKDLGYID